ncbi:hypothetical protein [Streptomyces nitrosporeus]|nr:hypothetical protein [Streptomyces nitrosporeus]
METAEGIQLDGFKRQDERHFRTRAAEYRCLDLPFVTPHVPRLSLNTA